MSRALRRVSALAFLLSLPACSDKKGAAPVPGANKIAQIYVLSSRSMPIEKYWDFPSKDALAASLGARVDWEAAGESAEVSDRLHVWNARPLDMIVLGPGLPQETWASLRLPKVGGRIVIAVGRETELPEVLSLSVPEARANALRTEFCRQTFGKPLCEAKKASPLNFRARWADFLKDLLSGKPQIPRTGPYSLDFFSGYLEASAGPELERAADREAFDKMKKEFMLNELGRSGPR